MRRDLVNRASPADRAHMPDLHISFITAIFVLFAYCRMYRLMALDRYMYIQFSALHNLFIFVCNRLLQ